MKQTGCIHSELIKEYAEDCQIFKEPWLLWEWYDSSDLSWETHRTHPNWYCNVKYRRKPRTININGYEVLEPLIDSPDEDQLVYLVDVASESLVHTFLFTNDFTSLHYLNKGLLHITKRSAELHAKALLSFTTTF